MLRIDRESEGENEVYGVFFTSEKCQVSKKSIQLSALSFTIWVLSIPMLLLFLFVWGFGGFFLGGGASGYKRLVHNFIPVSWMLLIVTYSPVAKTSVCALHSGICKSTPPSWLVDLLYQETYAAGSDSILQDMFMFFSPLLTFLLAGWSVKSGGPNIQSLEQVYWNQLVIKTTKYEDRGSLQIRE